MASVTRVLGRVANSPSAARRAEKGCKRSGTGSTEAATENSTVPLHMIPSHANAHTPPRSPTSNDDSKKAEHGAKQTAASSATSPAASTDSSNTELHSRLDKHRSIAGPRRTGSSESSSCSVITSGRTPRLPCAPVAHD
jgi:hypothetical protein